MSPYASRGRLGRFVCSVAVVLFAGAAVASAAAQGIRVRSGSKVLFGSPSRCMKPAQVDYEKLQRATAEFKTIKRDGIIAGSARYRILIQKMTNRLRSVIKEFAQNNGYDCVVVKGCVRRANGLQVPDVSSAVTQKLESTGGLG